MLLGNIQSDYIEGRFGWLRQLCGGNYFNTVSNFLQAEKTVCVSSIVSMGINMKEIGEIYKCADECSTTQHDEDANSFVIDLQNFKLEDTVSASHAEENIVFIAGYIARSICKKSSWPKIAMRLFLLVKWNSDLTRKRFWMIVIP